jgi:hypothetical protein
VQAQSEVGSGQPMDGGTKDVEDGCAGPHAP